MEQDSGYGALIGDRGSEDFRNQTDREHEKTSQSIKSKGWLPSLFRSIVNKAKEFLQNLIRQTALPPKPVLNLDMAEFGTMQKLMIQV